MKVTLRQTLLLNLEVENTSQQNKFNFIRFHTIEMLINVAVDDDTVSSYNVILHIFAQRKYI